MLNPVMIRLTSDGWMVLAAPVLDQPDYRVPERGLRRPTFLPKTRLHPALGAAILLWLQALVRAPTKPNAWKMPFRHSYRT